MLKAIIKEIKQRWYLTILVILSILSFSSVYISPTLFWPAIFASYAIPVILILSFILVIILPFIKKRRVIFPIVIIIFGIPFLRSTFRIGNNKISSEKEFSILSVNAHLFREPNTYSEFSIPMIKWAAEDKSDIKCFQEYSTNKRWEALDVTSQIAKEGYAHFVYAANLRGSDHNPGLAIFSKYPILDSGMVWKVQGSVNAGMFVDLLIDKDTIRIYNVHLESLKLKVDELKNPNGYWNKIKQLVKSLKKGASDHTWQTDTLIAHTLNSPYPYIICGDFNETPYSYNYVKLRDQFSNAFEEAGTGFGFTFNSFLFFLRIDHHFFSSEIQCSDFRVDRSMKISDHFPTYGKYTY